MGSLERFYGRWVRILCLSGALWEFCKIRDFKNCYLLSKWHASDFCFFHRLASYSAESSIKNCFCFSLVSSTSECHLPLKVKALLLTQMDYFIFSFCFKGRKDNEVVQRPECDPRIMTTSWCDHRDHSPFFWQMSHCLFGEPNIQLPSEEELLPGLALNLPSECDAARAHSGNQMVFRITLRLICSGASGLAHLAWVSWDGRTPSSVWAVPLHESS